MLLKSTFTVAVAAMLFSPLEGQDAVALEKRRQQQDPKLEAGLLHVAVSVNAYKVAFKAGHWTHGEPDYTQATVISSPSVSLDGNFLMH
ncbi:hypothetical protein AB1N83_006652 [Pleurotus pulmonarius]